jgi:hypothetical protein
VLLQCGRLFEEHLRNYRAKTRLKTRLFIDTGGGLRGAKREKPDNQGRNTQCRVKML